jgi:hypothetical protein
LEKRERYEKGEKEREEERESEKEYFKICDLKLFS